MIPRRYQYLPNRRLIYPKKTALNWKKFCIFMFFGVFATHLIYLGELTQIRYTAAKNKSITYSKFVDDYLHSTNKSEIMKKRTNIISAYYKMKFVQDYEKAQKVLILASNPRSGSSYLGEILTAMPNVSYFFEPLWLMSPKVNLVTESGNEVCMCGFFFVKSAN